MLWEKYKPTTLDDLDTNTNLVGNLRQMVRKFKDVPEFINMIVYGACESGKLTLVRCFLASLFDPSIYRLTPVEHNVRQNCSNYTVTIYKSPHHYEVSFAGLQYADRCVMTSLLDTYFTTANVDSSRFKLLVIRDFHLLTKPAQYSLRRRMETHYHAVRYIFITDYLNKIERALVSRCLSIRCPKPLATEILAKLKNICDTETIRVEDSTLDEIVKTCRGNVGKALYYLEVIKTTGSTKIENPADICIQKLLDCFQSKSYPCQRVREAISDLQLAKINSNIIFQRLVEWVGKNIDNPVVVDKSIHIISKYELVSAKYNRFSIAMETTMITLFNLYSGET